MTDDSKRGKRTLVIFSTCIGVAILSSVMVALILR